MNKPASELIALADDEAKALLLALSEAYVISDSYGVQGSDFSTCLVCQTGGTPGAKFEHDKHCAVGRAEKVAQDWLDDHRSEVKELEAEIERLRTAANHASERAGSMAGWTDNKLAAWARNWHWQDTADDKPVDPSIYFRDMRMLKAFVTALATPPAQPTQAKGNAIMTDDQIKYMVDRFLMWKLPEDFKPDGGVSYEPFGNAGTPHQYAHRPSGTNLFDATQADAMVRYMLDGISSHSPKAAETGPGDVHAMKEACKRVALDHAPGMDDPTSTYIADICERIAEEIDAIPVANCSDDVVALLREGVADMESFRPVAWIDGAPAKPWANEWFIAETTYGDRVVLTALPEEFTYAFKTADETYIMADKIKRWMQFPDSEYTHPTTKPEAPADNVDAIAPSRHHLTIPDQKTAAETVKRSGGTDGQEKLLKDLSRSPLARSECGYPRHMDHVHLARFERTDLCQWWGRCADGYHRPIGRIMQIVEAKQ